MDLKYATLGFVLSLGYLLWDYYNKPKKVQPNEGFAVVFKGLVLVLIYVLGVK